MKFYFFMLFLGLLCVQQSMASEAYVDFSELPFSRNPAQAIKTITESFPKKKSNILGLGLSGNYMKNEDFEKLTQDLTPNDFTSLHILDLSNNKIDENSVKSLFQWLNLASEPYVKITGTPLALKNVGNIYDKIIELNLSDDPSKFMGRIIFMSQGYIRKASQSVQIYKKLVDARKLPQSWSTILKKFYSSNQHYKKLCQKKSSLQYQSVIKNMQHLSMSSPKTPRPSQNLDLQETEDENGFSFVEAYKLVFNK